MHVPRRAAFVWRRWSVAGSADLRRLWLRQFPEHDHSRLCLPDRAYPAAVVADLTLFYTADPLAGCLARPVYGSHVLHSLNQRRRLWTNRTVYIDRVSRASVALAITWHLSRVFGSAVDLEQTRDCGESQRGSGKHQTATSFGCVYRCFCRFHWLSSNSLGILVCARNAAYSAPLADPAGTNFRIRTVD